MWYLGPHVTTLDAFKTYAAPLNPSMRDRIRKLLRALAKMRRVSLGKMMRTYEDDLDYAINHQYHQYNENVTDEEKMVIGFLHPIEIEPILGRFSNLLEFKMVNGKFLFSDNHIFKDWLDGSNSIPVPSGIDLRARGEGLWKCDLSSEIPYSCRLPTSMIVYAQQHHNIKELEINHLSCQFFQSVGPCSSMLGPRSMPWALTRLSLTVTFYTSTTNNMNNNMVYCRNVMSHGVLRGFIEKLPKLVDLSILTVCVNGQYHRAPQLHLVLSPILVKLQKLRLKYFETTESVVINILRNNAQTLRVLDLQDMHLHPQGSWVSIFDSFRRDQTCLQSAKFRGTFCDSIGPIRVARQGKIIVGYDNGWNFDNFATLGLRLEKFLIHGGSCPLLHSDKRGVLLGSIDSNHLRVRRNTKGRRMSASQAELGRSRLVKSRASAKSRTRRGSVGF
jgi:hypothetical protein